MEKDWKVLVNEQLDMAQQCELTAQEDTPGCIQNVRVAAGEGGDSPLC